MPGTLATGVYGGGTLGGRAGGQRRYPRIAVAREFPPDDLAVRISDPRTGQTITRLGADEALLENTIDALGYSSEMQGGCKEFGGQLARDPRIRWPDLAPYLDVTVYGQGVDEVWWGRIDKPEGSDGSQSLVNLKGVGHLAALEDDEAVKAGFIDADQTKWGDPSTERRRILREANIFLSAATSFGFSEKEGEGEPPSILNDFGNVTAEAGKGEAGEADYDSGGIDLEEVLYDYRVLAVPDTAFDSTMALGRESTFATEPVVGTDHNGTTALEQAVGTAVAGYRFARLRDLFSGPYEGPMTNLFAWQNIRVLALTGLALQGTWPNVGFTAKQMLEWAVPRFSYLQARAEDIEDDQFVIPHAWFAEEGTLATIVKELTKYGLLDWFVYEGKRLQLRRPGTYGRKWVAAPGPAEFREEGEDGTRLWKDIVVAWQDVDGSTKTVGPPGSGATYESASLEITDPDHPAVRAGIPRRDRIVTKTVCDFPTSLKLGENWLAEANELSHSGTCNLTHYVLDDKGIYHPASVVKAGDEVFFPGSGDPSYRRITHVDYDHNERKAACTLDAPADGLAAVQERFQVELQARGIA